MRRKSKSVTPTRTTGSLESYKTESMEGLTLSEARFITEYTSRYSMVRDYETPYQSVFNDKEDGWQLRAKKLFNRPDVKKAVSDQIVAKGIRALGTDDCIVAETIRLATYDISDICDDYGNFLPPHKLPKSISKAITKVKKVTKTDPEGNVIVTYEYTFANKAPFANLLFKHKDLIKESTTYNHIENATFMKVDSLSRDTLNELTTLGLDVDSRNKGTSTDYTFDGISDGVIEVVAEEVYDD